MMYRNMGFALGMLVFRLVTAAGFAADMDNPQLSVTRTAPGALLLTWPDWATNWTVEESAQLQADANWKPLAAGTNQLQRSIQPPTNGFFRLRKLSPTVPHLSGYWRFDEGSGGTSADEVPNSPNVFFTNSTWGTGRAGPKALRFNGGSSATASKAWVTNSGFSLLPSNGQPFSVSLWMNPETITNGSQLLIGAAGWSLSLQTPGPGTNNIIFASSGLNFSGRTLLLPGQWYEITFTYDGNRACLYLDANPLASGNGSVTTDSGQIFVGGGIAGRN